ncbi:DUF2231 domain-containing protein [Ferruginibacter profundus]
MNTAHFHLLLNHFPVIGTLIGSCLLLWGIIKKQDHIKSIAAIILGAMAIIAVPVYLTGEPAEEAVEKLPGVSEAIIELHEEAAGIAIWLMGITGIVALVAVIFAWLKRKTAGMIFIATFIISVISFAAMARTGYYGGQIRHTEIRNGNLVNQQHVNEEGNTTKEKDDD